MFRLMYLITRVLKELLRLPRKHMERLMCLYVTQVYVFLKTFLKMTHLKIETYILILMSKVNGKAVIPSMIANGGGAIVVTSSVTGDMVADPGEVAYATSKAALVGFTKALAREFADKNIRVNAICPGYVRTPLVEGMAKQSDPENPERAIQAIADAVPLKRLADPEEVGELAAFLGCYESSYITGTQIVIDGGSTLPETTSMGQ